MRPILLLLFASFIAAPVDDERVADFSLSGTDGKLHTLYEHKQAKAVALVFLGNECPASVRYPARLVEMHKTYSNRSVVFLGVNSNAPESAESITKWARENSLPFPVLLDPDQALADRLRVSTIPCVVLVDTKWSIRYRGRIDDHKNEQLVKHRYLRDAIEAVLAGKDVEIPATEPVGCKVQRRLAASENAEVTYSEHIAPILNNHCVTCHRPGQVAPFSLTNYEEASRWAVDLFDAAKTRRMPPWMPSNHGMFRDERILKADEIDLIGRWVKAGAPKGDPAKMPAPPKFAEGWTLGQPDLVLTAEEFELPAEGEDEYRCFVLPTNLGEDKWVAAVEMKPGNTRVVHHILGYVDTSGQSDRLDQADPLPGYRANGTGPRFMPAGEMSGWAPGTTAYALPEGIGRILPQGSKVVLEVHYHKNGRKEKDRTSVGLYFAKKPVTQRLQWFSLVNWWFKIPAGEKRHKVVATHTVKEDLTLRTIAPHMHLIGRDVEVVAEFPDRTKKTLVHIPEWDFNWQDSYHFKEPIFIPKGTKLTATVIYDNSAENPQNPNHPPKAMSWGEQTTDEMCIIFLSYTRPGKTELDRSEEDWR